MRLAREGLWLLVANTGSGLLCWICGAQGEVHMINLLQLAIARYNESLGRRRRQKASRGPRSVLQRRASRQSSQTVSAPLVAPVVTLATDMRRRNTRRHS